MDKEPRDHFLSNAAYDKLKFVAQILLPAVGTLYAVLGGYWDWPKTEAVVGSIMAFDAFLGALLGLSTASYNSSEAKYDGDIEIVQDETEQKKLFTLSLTSDPDDLESKDQVIFKIVNK